MTLLVKTSTMHKLKGTYIRTFSEKLAALQQYLSENDWLKIERFGHQLKGSGKAYGFSKISDLGAQIEECADLHNGSKALALQTELQTVMKKISSQHQGNHNGQ